MGKGIRAIVYGIGRVNCIATRLMIEKGVEIVGAINRPGAKVGKDLGELSGISRLGVSVSDDPEHVLATPADIAVIAIYDDLERMLPIYKQCLEAGVNVITVGAHASYPWRLEPALSQELDDIAKTHGVTISGSGNQDFFIVHLGALMSGVCHRVDTIVHRSLTDVNNFGSETAEIAYVDQSIDSFQTETDNQTPSVYTTFWDNVAAALELTVVDVVQTLEPVVTTTPRICRSLNRTIQPGSLIGIRQRLEVSTKENVRMTGENGLWVCDSEEEEYKDWEIIGEPSFKIRVTDLETGFTTASQYVNRIPHIINAPPGYVTIDQLPKLTYRQRLVI